MTATQFIIYWFSFGMMSSLYLNWREPHTGDQERREINNRKGFLYGIIFPPFAILIAVIDLIYHLVISIKAFIVTFIYGKNDNKVEEKNLEEEEI
jgi:hypothetical protein